MTAREEYGDKSWTAFASSYDAIIGRLTSHAASRLIELSNNIWPFSCPDARILDNGAGTGVLTLALAEAYPRAQIIAADISPGMLSVIEEKHIPNISCMVLDAGNEESYASLLQKHVDGREAGQFTHALSTFMIQFLPDAKHVVRLMSDALVPGGLLGLAIWDAQNDPWAVWAKACKAVDGDYVVPKANEQSAWYTTAEMKNGMQETGFNDVVEERVKVRFEAESAEGIVKTWFEAGNPSLVSMINHWKQNGTRGLESLKKEMIRIVKDEYSDGRELYVWQALAIGTKSA